MNGRQLVLQLVSTGVCLALASDAVAESGVDGYVNDDAVRLKVEFPHDPGDALFDVSWLHHGDYGDLVSLGAHLTGEPVVDSPFSMGLGVRLDWVDNDRRNKENGASLAFGGFARYRLGARKLFSIGGSYHYAPSALTLDDAEGLSDLHLFVGFDLVKNAEVYLGWRRLKSKFDDDGWVSIDDGIHLGLHLRFGRP